MKNLRHFCDASPLPQCQLPPTRRQRGDGHPHQARLPVPGFPDALRRAELPSVIGKSEGSERRQTPPEVRGKRRPAPPHLLHTGPCKNAGVHTHTDTHTHSGRGENYTRLTPWPLSKQQHQGWMAQWLDPTKDLARRLARHASCPVAGTAPPTHRPHEGRGRQRQGQGREEVLRGEWRLSGDKGGGESRREAGKRGEEAAAQTTRAPAGTRPPGRSCGLCTGQSEAEEPGPQGRRRPVDSKWLSTSRAGSDGQLAGRSLGFG